MSDERVEVFIYINKIDKSKATYGLYFKYYNKYNEFIVDKKICSNIIQYKKFEEVVYDSLIITLKTIRDKRLQLIIYCSFDGIYPRCKELDKLVKKFYRINFIFNYEDETAKLLSKKDI